jgi:hypothetical protein
LVSEDESVVVATRINLRELEAITIKVLPECHSPQ